MYNHEYIQTYRYTGETVSIKKSFKYKPFLEIGFRFPSFLSNARSKLVSLVEYGYFVPPSYLAF